MRQHFKKLYKLLFLLLSLLLLAGCAGSAGESPDYLIGDSITEAAIVSTPAPGDALRLVTDPPVEIIDAPPGVTPGPDWTVSYNLTDGTITYRPPVQSDEETVSAAPDPGPDGVLPPPEDTVPPTRTTEDGEYTDPEDVAEYLYLYGHLPGNFITKKEAQALGWPGGNLWKYAPGKSIGGDRFGNYEGLLPKGSYHECDVNYSGGSRGAERIIYSTDGRIYYTDDHYQTFTQLY